MSEPITSRELVRVIAADFDRRGWGDRDGLALAIASQAEREQRLDSSSAVARAPQSFFSENGTSAGALGAALKEIFAARTLVDADRPGPTFVDQSVTIGDNNSISGDINAGGNQVHLSNHTSPAELLSSFEKFVGIAASEGFAPRELELLDRLLAAQDLDSGDVEAAARTGIEASAAEPGRLAKFRDTVAASASSGLAVQGILAALGALF